jgi:hypothetical protein
MSWTGTIPVYINNFNRLGSLKGMIDFFKEIKTTRVIVVDNGSTYPPLLEWYKRHCPAQIVYLDGNFGHHAPWRQRIIPGWLEFQDTWGSGFYIETDPDLDLTGVPKDLIDVLIQGFTIRQESVKVGLSLEIEDVPDSARERVEKNERHYWAQPITDQFFFAPVDTTLALYRARTPHNMAIRIDPALRTNRPYCARHVPWYNDPNNLSEEDKYYYQHCNQSASWRP